MKEKHCSGDSGDDEIIPHQSPTDSAHKDANCKSNSLAKHSGTGAFQRDYGIGTESEDTECSTGSKLRSTEEVDPWEATTTQESTDFWNNTEVHDWAAGSEPQLNTDVWSTAAEGDTAQTGNTAVGATVPSDLEKPPVIEPVACSDRESENLPIAQENDDHHSDADNDLDLDLDPHCISDDVDGDLYVIEDSDYSEDEGRAEKAKTKWRPVVKKDPAPIHEVLQLAFEEVR